jgi:DNA replication protein DnaC
MEQEHLLERLKMDHLEGQIDAVCEQATKKQLDYKACLIQTLKTEWQGRFQKDTEARLRQERFPWLKTLEQFDFDFQPSLDRRVVRELEEMSFVTRAYNVVILGPPGIDKTQQIITLGVRVVEAGYSALFFTREPLMTWLECSQ